MQIFGRLLEFFEQLGKICKNLESPRKIKEKQETSEKIPGHSWERLTKIMENYQRIRKILENLYFHNHQVLNSFEL